MDRRKTGALEVGAFDSDSAETHRTVEVAHRQRQVKDQTDQVPLEVLLGLSEQEL
jgi:hypothetical protein